MKPTTFTATIVLTLTFSFFSAYTCLAQLNTRQDAGVTERKYLVDMLTKIADPVLKALEKNRLKKDMPVESNGKNREKHSHLEAFGRLLAGMAPWLELGPDNSTEGTMRDKYLKLARNGLDHATDPTAADFMNFNDGNQALVDAAFLAQGLLRAPNQLWLPLDDRVKQNIIKALKSTRIFTPPNNNWLLFSAEIEAALLKFEGKCDEVRIEHALQSHELWYKGDGTYGDGPNFHWDYYNSYVIQPMLLEVLQTILTAKTDTSLKKTYTTVLKRAQRFASVQESLISPEGTYPPLGRSLAYRFGAFQLLAKMALMDTLPESITPQQVRAALYTVIRKQAEAPGTFDKQGWLTIGFSGRQPKIGEGYISTGSLYLCSQRFLMLGLPANHAFWNGPDEEWTSRKIWSGKDISVDRYIN
jgi:hypothetical protein